MQFGFELGPLLAALGDAAAVCTPGSSTTPTGTTGTDTTTGPPTS